jgi:hypothetical protein
MSLVDLKKELKKLDKAEIIELVADLYKKISRHGNFLTSTSNPMKAHYTINIVTIINVVSNATKI